jgi:hypothetical protein
MDCMYMYLGCIECNTGLDCKNVTDIKIFLKVYKIFENV